MSSRSTRAGKRGANWNERYAHLSVQASWRVLVDLIPSDLPLLDEDWGLKTSHPPKAGRSSLLGVSGELTPWNEPFFIKKISV